MKNIISFIIILVQSIHVFAQVKPLPIKIKAKNADGIKVTNALEKQEAINKILNASLTDVQFEVRFDNPSHTWFAKRSIEIKGNNADPLRLIRNLKIAKNYKNASGYTEYNFNGNKGEHDNGNGGLTYTTYKSLLENGFTININFTERLSRIVGKTFAADFLVHFKFNNSSKVTIMLQDFNYNGKGTWKRDADLNITKTFKGDAFPDPSNPLVLKTIK